jgi:hypothetical protein
MAVNLKLGLNTVLRIHNDVRNTAGVRSQEEELEGGKNSLKSEKVIGR